MACQLASSEEDTSSDEDEFVEVKPKEVRLFDEEESDEAEYEFVERLSEDQICPICKKVLNHPHLINCCEKQFCHECLVKWLRENRTCPHCRSTNHFHMLMQVTSRKLGKLKVYCPKKKNGCQTILRKDELDNHLSKSCLFVKVSCPKDCGFKVFRGDLEKHINRECPKRIVSCPYCKGRGEYVNVRHHLKTCPQRPVACPNECGTEVPRKDLKNHRGTCPLEKVRCLFHEVGCKAVVCRSDLEKHIMSSVADHLTTLAKSHLSMKEEHTQTCQAIREEHKKTCQAIRDEHKKTCQAIAEVMKSLPKNISGIVQVAQIQTLLSDSSDAELDKPLYLTLSESNMKSGQHHIRVDGSIYMLQWEQLHHRLYQYRYRFTLLYKTHAWNHISKISIFPYIAKKREYIELNKACPTGIALCICKEDPHLQIETVFSRARE